ncbi:MAG TPA: ABC transporter, partial [Firmicutes bacterium]|nr:ABC transporter [Bacillota bacterium]
VINHGTIVLDTRVSHLKRDYIAGKIVDLRVTTEVTDFSFPGVTVLKSSKYGLKLSIDSTVQSIDRVLAHLMHDYQVVDITISDPPLEQVISSIYNEGPVPAHDQ